MTGTGRNPYSWASDARDEDLLTIPSSALGFLSEYKREPDFEKLRATLSKIWQESRSKFHVYKCIATFQFLKPRVADHPLYRTLVEELKSEKTGALPVNRVLELGCCFGTDVRKLMQDGVPASRIVASDLHAGYWQLGMKLYDDADRIAGVETVFGDWAVSPNMSSVAAVADEDTLPPVDFAAYRAHFSFVVASAILHCLSEVQIQAFIGNVADVLVPGGTFLGSCVGRVTEGAWMSSGSDQEVGSQTRYLHSPESLEKLLRRFGFKDVVVEAKSVPSTEGSGNGGEKKSPADMNHGLRMLFQATRM
ncbi:hypothetical protein HDU87_005544 [Geranomyces variabilis]|uniref:Methyltransferase domain-containing protein n=1 Tax=Geranomyces variabilis TaxID=109894 RepID=A0AAD5XL08_9FUNG|nr:hypothetical protein HDU87_005544 [Geranomyces variabilis]